jgi:iron complex outermembrane receptor protein
VLVTAQRKSQNLQDVPISISVVSAEDIARNAIFNFADTAQLTPGVELNATSPALAAIKLRGVGADFFAAGAAQSVPIFVDEVAASQPGAVFATMVDVERLEVLRGPQGTLYGRNAPAGAYNITTVAPSMDELKGFLQGSVSRWDSTGEPTLDARGALNLPLLDDQLAMRIAGVYAESDGGVRMGSPLATEETTGGKDHKSIRGRLLWTPGERSEIHLHGQRQSLRDFYSWQLYDGLVPATGGTNTLPAIFSDFGDRTDYGTFRSGSKTDVNDLSLRYLYSGQPFDVAAIVGYQQFETDFQQNQAPNPGAEEGRVLVDLVTDQYTLELRVSDTGEVIDYVAGLFLIQRETVIDSFLSVGGAEVENFLDSEVFGQAAFGNLTYHLDEQWDLSVGLRYDENTDELFTTVDVANFPAVIEEKQDYSHLSWSIKLNHYVSDSMTAYLAVDNAYREGGLSPYIPAILSIGEALGAQSIIDTAPLFFETDKEVSTAFEVGLKGTLADKRIRYSANLFYQQYDDHITRLPEPNFSELTIIGALYTLVNTNVEDVVTQGVELDLSYRISDPWTLDFRLAYFDATVEKWSSRFCSDQFGDSSDQALCPAESGQDLTNAPKINANTQLNYSRQVFDGWLLSSHLSWTWRSESDGDGVTRRYNDALHFLNLNLSLAKGNHLFSLWGKNLTDELSGQIPNEIENGDPTQPSALAIPNTPGRELGVTVSYRF